ncbi:hypothetical protein F5X99DRAFT_409598 [Biscogniauxia marginata]|nr:hypothetical protein F5X99DRAFT_409598 [Biscogniauxia marginata]
MFLIILAGDLFFLGRRFRLNPGVIGDSRPINMVSLNASTTDADDATTPVLDPDWRQDSFSIPGTPVMSGVGVMAAGSGRQQQQQQQRQQQQQQLVRMEPTLPLARRPEPVRPSQELGEVGPALPPKRSSQEWLGGRAVTIPQLYPHGWAAQHVNTNGLPAFDCGGQGILIAIEAPATMRLQSRRKRLIIPECSGHPDFILEKSAEGGQNVLPQPLPAQDPKKFDLAPSQAAGTASAASALATPKPRRGIGATLHVGGSPRATQRTLRVATTCRTNHLTPQGSRWGRPHGRGKAGLPGSGKAWLPCLCGGNCSPNGALPCGRHAGAIVYQHVPRAFVLHSRSSTTSVGCHPSATTGGQSRPIES